MQKKSINARIITKHNSSEKWAEHPRYVLLDGEMAYETDTKKFKIGDGVTAWEDLPYGIKAADSMHTFKEFTINPGQEEQGIPSDWVVDQQLELKTEFSATINDQSVTSKDSCMVYFNKDCLDKCNEFGVSQICETIDGGIKIFSAQKPDVILSGKFEIKQNITN